MIRHIVMWKFREGEEENREKFLSGLQALDGVVPRSATWRSTAAASPAIPTTPA